MKNEKTAKKPMPKTAKIIIISVIALIIIAFVFGLIYLKPQTLIKKLDIDQSSIDKIVLDVSYNDEDEATIGLTEEDTKTLTEKSEIDDVFSFINSSKKLLFSNLKDPQYMGGPASVTIITFYSKNEFVKSIRIPNGSDLFYVYDKPNADYQDGTVFKSFSTVYTYPLDYTAFINKQFPDNKALKKEMESIDENTRLNPQNRTFNREPLNTTITVLAAIFIIMQLAFVFLKLKNKWLIAPPVLSAITLITAIIVQLIEHSKEPPSFWDVTFPFRVFADTRFVIYALLITLGLMVFGIIKNVIRKKHQSDKETLEA